MPTLSPSDVVAASGFVAKQLDTSKRRGLATLAALWTTVDEDDIRLTLGAVVPLMVELMHQQQAAGRVAAWSQAQLAASVAYASVEPGTVSLPLNAARDGRMASGMLFEQVAAGAVPGVLSRIGAGAPPREALALSQRVAAQALGSVAHDEARATTEDVVLTDTSATDRVNGYARRTEGAFTCDFCRMLATRGPVYRKDTAGFRAHAFCDCTVYAVAMDQLTVADGDWTAYERWAAKRASRTANPAAPSNVTAIRRAASDRGITLSEFRAATPPRLAQVEAQIASYEPVIATGNATEWMRQQLPRLYAERQVLLAQAA
jgi:hypothetical protein